MNLKSKYFDRIRVKPEQDRLKSDENPICEVDGCRMPGVHRAPKGRGHDGQYHQFCMNHVREYNKSYNYFKDMSDTDVAEYQRSARTGHRPTWSLGTNKGLGGIDEEIQQQANPSSASHTSKFSDPFGFFGEKYTASKRTRTERRQVRNAERKALATLGLDIDVEPEEAKARYKMLVKRHHPDANGGGQEYEEKLREIIQAYDYLKSSGFC